MERYWERFADSGKITDYLNYRGMDICEKVMERYADKCQENVKSDGAADESDYGDRNGASGTACR